MKRTCQVCNRELSPTARRHTRTCSARCRKALSRREIKEEDTVPQNVDALAEHIYLLTAASARSLAYDSLPEEAKAAYRELVRHIQATKETT